MRRLGAGLGALLRSVAEEPQVALVRRGRILHPYRRRQFHSFGRDSFIHKPNWIYGASKIAVGSDCVLLHGIWLSAERPSWRSEGPVIVIGDRVGVRPYCTISATESIVIEDYVTISAFSSVIDSDHTFGAGGTVLDQPMVTEAIRIGEGTWIGERTAVLRGANIGVQCAIGSNSVVRGEIPDYSVAVGVPARVVGSTREGSLLSEGWESYARRRADERQAPREGRPSTRPAGPAGPDGS